MTLEALLKVRVVEHGSLRKLGTQPAATLLLFFDQLRRKEAAAEPVAENKAGQASSQQ